MNTALDKVGRWIFESNAAPAWTNPRKRLKNHDAWKFPLPNPNTLQTQPDSLAEHDVDLTPKAPTPTMAAPTISKIAWNTAFLVLNNLTLLSFLGICNHVCYKIRVKEQHV